MIRDGFDASRGYDALARAFMLRRNPLVGATAVRQWVRHLRPGGAVLDLGCGHGVPVSQTLIEEGFTVYGIDASPAMVTAFRTRFPEASVACEAVENSRFFGRTFDGVIAWGLLFLLEAEEQVTLIHHVAAALEPNGRFLFTAPEQVCSWTDVLTGRESVSLGAAVYRATFGQAGLMPMDEYRDEGGNYYYDARRE